MGKKIIELQIHDQKLCIWSLIIYFQLYGITGCYTKQYYLAISYKINKCSYPEVMYKST